MTDCLLSIVVPTRNRARYALSCIHSILDIQSGRLELVIQDQSDSDELGKALRDIPDARLSYQRDNSPKNHVENFNNAIKRAKGTYIVVIGDDDGISREIIQAVEWAESKDIDALTPTQCATYHWPDFRHYFYGDAFAGRFILPTITGSLSYPDIEPRLVDWSRDPGRNTKGLPKVYHGIIRRACLQELIDVHGGWFFGVSPDIASAIAATRYVRNFCWIDYPLVIAGGSGGSAAGRGAMNTHTGTLKEDPHMRGFQHVIWPEVVPEIFTVETVMAQSALEGMRIADRNDLIKSFNFVRLHAQCLYHHPKEVRAILQGLARATRANPHTTLALNIVKMGYHLLQIAAARAGRILWRIAHPSPSAGQIMIGPYQDIRMAALALDKHLQEIGWRFQKVISNQ